MYFKKIEKFDFDLNRLYQEWFSLSTELNHIPNVVTNYVEHSGKNFLEVYKRINVNFSDLETTEEYIPSPNDDSYPIESYNAKNILPKFSSSYTKEVVEKIEQFFNERGLRSTRIKYAALKSYSNIGTHIDPFYKKRYHFTVHTNDKCSMIINGETYVVGENNTLYSMYANVPHSVHNDSEQTRLFLSFDAIPIK